jgi:hypothetical protein
VNDESSRFWRSPAFQVEAGGLSLAERAASVALLKAGPHHPVEAGEREVEGGRAREETRDDVQEGDVDAALPVRGGAVRCDAVR